MIKFHCRKNAGKILADKLTHYLQKQQNQIHHNEIVVVGLPRGGAIVALEVARAFGSQLEILVSKKIPYPGDEEFAIGAVTSDGEVVLNPKIPDTSPWEHYIEEHRQRLLHQTKESECFFYDNAGHVPCSLEKKIVIIVDDGIATGMTALAAIETVRQRGAKMIIMAAPVMSLESHHEVSKLCQHVVANNVPSDLSTIGQFYEDFRPVSNEEVVIAMQESRHFAPPADLSFILQCPNEKIT